MGRCCVVPVSRQRARASEPGCRGKQILNALPDAPLVTERANVEAFFDRA
jgi:hypothetical protein